MQKEILRPGYLLNQKRFEQSQLTPCPSLPRAQPPSCSAGPTTRSMLKQEDLVRQIILVRKFSWFRKTGMSGSSTYCLNQCSTLTCEGLCTGQLLLSAMLRDFREAEPIPWFTPVHLTGSAKQSESILFSKAFYTHVLCMCNAFVLSTELCKVSIKRYIKGCVLQAEQWDGGICTL